MIAALLGLELLVLGVVVVGVGDETRAGKQKGFKLLSWWRSLWLFY